jgi:hypothetical protein
VLDQAEIATDVMFGSRAALGEIMPDLVGQASWNRSSADVVRFLGRKLHPALKAEVTTDTKDSEPGNHACRQMVKPCRSKARFSTTSSLTMTSSVQRLPRRDK